MSLTSIRVGQLKLKAEQRLEKVPANKIEHAYCNVLPREILALCDLAQPSTEEESQKVAELRLGSAQASNNAQLDGVFVRASDLLVLATLASRPLAIATADDAQDVAQNPPAAHAALDLEEDES